MPQFQRRRNSNSSHSTIDTMSVSMRNRDYSTIQDIMESNVTEIANGGQGNKYYFIILLVVYFWFMSVCMLLLCWLLDVYKRQLQCNLFGHSSLKGRGADSYRHPTLQQKIRLPIVQNMSN